jgi:uncharacterized protein (TIGR02452 family)
MASQESRAREAGERYMDRTQAAELGRETVRILEQGGYSTATGRLVQLAPSIEHAVGGTQSYPPDEALPKLTFGERATSYAVVNASTLEEARRLVEAGRRAVALNFASAKHPGGGFRSGARAQEESLARSSALYACLVNQPMYEFHRSRHDPLYTDYAIYSPDVPVFRTDDGALLDRPYLCSFITAPAVNAGVVLQRAPSRRPEVRAAMARRVHKVLTIGAMHGHVTMVLGAWGCGAFRNDPQEVAELFHEALDTTFLGAFSQVVFAVWDWSAERRSIGPFEAAFKAGHDLPAGRALT